MGQTGASIGPGANHEPHRGGSAGGHANERGQVGQRSGEGRQGQRLLVSCIGLRWPARRGGARCRLAAGIRFLQNGDGLAECRHAARARAAFVTDFLGKWNVVGIAAVDAKHIEAAGAAHACRESRSTNWFRCWSSRVLSTEAMNVAQWDGTRNSRNDMIIRPPGLSTRCASRKYR